MSGQRRMRQHSGFLSVQEVAALLGEHRSTCYARSNGATSDPSRYDQRAAARAETRRRAAHRWRRCDLRASRLKAAPGADTCPVWRLAALLAKPRRRHRPGCGSARGGPPPRSRRCNGGHVHRRPSRGACFCASVYHRVDAVAWKWRSEWQVNIRAHGSSRMRAKRGSSNPIGRDIFGRIAGKDEVKSVTPPRRCRQDQRIDPQYSQTFDSRVSTGERRMLLWIRTLNGERRPPPLRSTLSIWINLFPTSMSPSDPRPPTSDDSRGDEQDVGVDAGAEALRGDEERANFFDRWVRAHRSFDR